MIPIWNGSAGKMELLQMVCCYGKNVIRNKKNMKIKEKIV